MNIAIIGGGVFGAMTAIRLAELDQTVSLFERLPGLMKGASFNANRLHQGFHYPRDEETAHQCMRGFQRFREEFGGAVLEDVTNAYFIASAGSLTSPSDFLAFCCRIGLFYKTIELDRCNPAVNNVALGVMTDEQVYDPAVLRRLLAERLQRSGVSTHVGSSVTDISRDGTNGFELSVESEGRACFDAVVNCTYPEINRLTAQLGHPIEARLYEYTAAAVVELDLPAPASITVLDWPFMTLLPFGTTGHHLLYHVQHSVIAQAREPLLDPAWLDPDASPFTSVNQERWFRTLLKSCCEFVPALRGASLRRILQGPRMVLVDREDTDARPSIVTEHERGYITALSGKIDHCVWVADEVATTLGCVRR